MNKTVIWIIGGVVSLGLIVWLAASIAGEGDVNLSEGFGEVVAEGDPLPVYGGDPTTDVATVNAMTAPTVSGADADGNEYTIGPDGRPKIILFVAHWCPHCQAEVPVVQDWIDAGNLPDGVDMYSMTVATNRSRDGSTWPPQDWLESEGWTVPYIMDDADSTGAAAYGMAGTPFYLVLDGDNVTLARLSGEIGTGGLDGLAALAASSAA